jgi:hypothetical protein
VTKEGSETDQNTRCAHSLGSGACRVSRRYQLRPQEWAQRAALRQSRHRGRHAVVAANLLKSPWGSRPSLMAGSLLSYKRGLVTSPKLRTPGLKRIGRFECRETASGHHAMRSSTSLPVWRGRESLPSQHTQGSGDRTRSHVLLRTGCREGRYLGRSKQRGDSIHGALGFGLVRHLGFVVNCITTGTPQPRGTAEPALSWLPPAGLTFAVTTQQLGGILPETSRIRALPAAVHRRFNQR